MNDFHPDFNASESPPYVTEGIALAYRADEAHDNGDQERFAELSAAAGALIGYDTLGGAYLQAVQGFDGLQQQERQANAARAEKYDTKEICQRVDEVVKKAWRAPEIERATVIDSATSRRFAKLLYEGTHIEMFMTSASAARASHGDIFLGREEDVTYWLAVDGLEDASGKGNFSIEKTVRKGTEKVKTKITVYEDGAYGAKRYRTIFDVAEESFLLSPVERLDEGEAFEIVTTAISEVISLLPGN